MSTIRPERSLLFVPGDRPERFDKAAHAGADRVIVDLEDAVLPQRKDEARELVGAWHGVAEGVVRINAFGTPWFDADVDMVRAAGAGAVMLPKSESAEVLDLLHERLGVEVGIYPLVETVAGAMAMPSLASAPGVRRLVFGSVDFALDSGIQDENSWRPVQTQMVLVSRHAGILPPVDGVVLDWRDQDAVRQSTEQSRRMGFGARLCIHPQQVAAVNVGMMPTPAEMDWARRVVEATRNSPSGAVVVDGKMVDEPIKRIAMRWLGLEQG